jgi:pimeloyl-ACP methyl ester carboxylesterase
MHERTLVETPLRLHGGENENTRGRQLLFLHGVSRNWRTFHTLCPALNDRFHISALDFRGHGNSERTPNHYRVIDYVDDALQCLEGMNASETIVYGHSLGAMVALAVAAKRPDRVSAIVLEDPPFSTMGENLPNTPLGEYFRGMKRVVESSRDAKELYQSFGSLEVGGRPLRELRDEVSLRFAAEGFTMLDPAVFEPIVAGRWLEGYDLASLLRQVRCPVLIFQADGKAGGMLRDDEAQQIADTVRDCRLVHVAGAPHLIHWIQPQTILDAMEEFLQ